MLGVRAFTRWLAVAMLAVALWPTAAWAAAVTKPLNSVSFSDSTHGYIAGSPNGVDGVLSWTNNGGDSWHAKAISSHFMVGVCASADGGTVAAVASDYNNIYTSDDAGVHWAAETNPLFGQTASFSDAAFLSGDRRVVVGKLTPSNDLALIGSAVGVGSWNIDFQGPFHPAPDINSDPPDTQAVISSIDAVSNGNVAWAVGIDKTTNNQGPFDPLIYKTVDGGSSWVTQTVTGTTPGITCVSAVDTQTAFIGQESRTLLRTLDGSTWDSVSLPIVFGITPVKAIDALDADHVLVVGENGHIAWTTNGSASTPTWSANTTATPNVLLGAQMIDATHWIVVGDNETILRTSDAGLSWSGSTGLAPPTVAITSPQSEHVLDSATIAMGGISNDGHGIGVANVEVRVQRGDGWCWDGSKWVASSDTWLPADQTDSAHGWDSWQRTVTLPDTASAGGSLTLWARATDGAGLTSIGPSVGAASPSSIALSAQSITIAYHGTATFTGTLRSAGAPLTSGRLTISPASSPYAPSVTTNASGNFSFTVAPSSKVTYTLRFAGDPQHKATSAQVTVIPREKVGSPVVPRYVRSTRSFKAYCDLFPRHASGGVATFTFQRYERQRGRLSWVTKRTSSARAVSYKSWSRSTVTVKLKTGHWRTSSVYSDSMHAKSYSPSRTFTVH